MRALLIFVASCASASSPVEPSAGSVRDRLATETHFFIGSDASSGSIDAQRWTHDGWQDGETILAIASGELIASIDATGALAATFDLEVEPIALPDTVFGAPAQLTGLRLRAPATTAPIVWTSDDDGSATVELDLELAWSIAIAGASSPLGTLHLPPLAMDVSLAGDGHQAFATLGLHAAGTLWSWADLLRLTGLDLTLAGATVD